jgi:hypothetical protein
MLKISLKKINLRRRYSVLRLRYKKTERTVRHGAYLASCIRKMTKTTLLSSHLEKLIPQTPMI